MKIRVFLLLSCFLSLNIVSVSAQKTSSNYIATGIKYYKGDGVTKDYSTALKYFKKAAELGNSTGQNWVGYMYEHGYGATKSSAEAFNWYKKAADQGNATAQNNLGYMLLQTKDYAKALSWFKKSADQGKASAQRNLGYMYYRGYGVTPNYLESMKWYKKAADQGDKDAQKKVAELEEKIRQNNVSTNRKPVLSWLSFDPTSTQKNYSFKIGVKSNSKIEEVSVYVNGTLTRGIVPVADDGFNMKINRTVTLNEGENTIKVTVRNAGGATTTQKKVTYHDAHMASIDWIAFNPVSTKKQYSLKAGIKSTSKIKSWTVKVNGMTERGIKPVMADGYDLKIEKTLSLAEGNNTIKIELCNASGVAVFEKNVFYNSSPALSTVKNEKRIALIIGNSKYPEQGLPNPQNDASDVAAKLKALGFDVTLKLNMTHESMDDQIVRFCQKAKGYDVALFYYAGHGIQHNGENFLIPVDAKLSSENRLKYECVNMNSVLDEMESSNSKMKIIILDACRNNPFERRWNRTTRGVRGQGAGLTDKNMNASGTLIAYSTNPGNVAQDGEGRNSPYTAGLLKMIDEPNVPIEIFFKNVRKYVKQQTRGAQEPWEASSIDGDFYFNKK